MTALGMLRFIDYFLACNILVLYLISGLVFSCSCFNLIWSSFWLFLLWYCFFFFKQKTAYELRISDWSSDVCSSDLAVFQEILAVAVDDDGIVFRPEPLRAAAARAEDEYAGVRIDFVAELAGARLPMHVDIGYGDAITPGAIEIEYPSLLGQPTEHLLAYPPETVVAENFQAMVALAMLNTRLKDFSHIWSIAGFFAFAGTVPSLASKPPFDRPQTP